MARIHRKLYKKDLHDPDNHDGVITALEPDILACEVIMRGKVNEKENTQSIQKKVNNERNRNKTDRTNSIK